MDSVLFLFSLKAIQRKDCGWTLITHIVHGMYVKIGSEILKACEMLLWQ